MRIFLSSTSRDLQEHRQTVIVGINRLGHQAVAMEYFIAEDATAVEKCVEEARKAALYIGIIARRYGFIPKGYDASITELEYRAAVAGRVPTLIFLLDEGVTWPDEYTDRGGPAESLHRFRQELQEKIVSFFRLLSRKCQGSGRLAQQ
jgi:hypothetical protein